MTQLIKADFVRTMAAYNRWQNDSIYGAAASLTDDVRQAERGAFFGSIQATLSHLLWGDKMWMSRFAGTDKPVQKGITDSVREAATWSELAAARQAMDDAIDAWAARITDAELAHDLTWYSAVLERELSKPLSMLVTHFFNHQTHHRGQVHAMLTAAGARPDNTDLFLMPDRGP